MRTVYLAGPISGHNYAGVTCWRDIATRRLHAAGVRALSPMRDKTWARSMASLSGDYADAAGADYAITGAPMAIRARDFNDVMTCDLLFVYLPKEMNDRGRSWGTAIEIGWASAMQKPIVLVSDDPSLTQHPLILGSVGWIVPDLDTGLDAVLSVLAS